MEAVGGWGRRRVIQYQEGSIVDGRVEVIIDRK